MLEQFKIYIRPASYAENILMLKNLNIKGIMEINTTITTYFKSIKYSKFVVKDSVLPFVDAFIDFIQIIRTEYEGAVLLPDNIYTNTLLCFWAMKTLKLPINMATAMITSSNHQAKFIAEDLREWQNLN